MHVFDPPPRCMGHDTVTHDHDKRFLEAIVAHSLAQSRLHIPCDERYVDHKRAELTLPGLTFTRMTLKYLGSSVV